MREFDAPSSAMQSVPAGAWAVGVSGGADSVALLSFLRDRKDLSLRVVHLDHQTRNGASAEDAEFVAELANRWQLPLDSARLDEILPHLKDPPPNRSARFRAARIEFFRQVVSRHGLSGVVLAHHADDQAETVLLRLLRGSGYSGLTGMSPRSVVCGLTILRPLLNIRRCGLRGHLQKIGQTWREDQSNSSPQYARSRVRELLHGAPCVFEASIDLAQACDELRQWANYLPDPPERLPLGALQDLPTIVARQQARKWLTARGADAADLTVNVLDRLIAMARDRATARKQQFPGNVNVVRRGGMLSIEH